jgi:hypothetical protein
MKLIEALKQLQANARKCDDLRTKIQAHCADLSHETPPYGDRQEAQIKSWLQSHHDTVKETERLRLAIQHTNLATDVTIEVGGVSVTKSIAAWIHRRKDLAAQEALCWRALNDRGLKEGKFKTSQEQVTDVKIRRYFAPAERDAKLAVYLEEPHLIDARLEVVNAVTDLIEEAGNAPEQQQAAA